MKEKEKDNLLKDAVVAHKDEDRHLKATLERIFPELKESEDERIRVFLVDFIKVCKWTEKEDQGWPTKDACVAWLKKQGKYDMGISEVTKQKLEDNLNKALEKETPESLNKFLDEQKHTEKVELIVIRDFNSVFSREQIEEIDKRIEESQRLYNAKLRDAMRKVEDFPMTD